MQNALGDGTNMKEGTKDVAGFQQPSGAFALKGWIRDSGGEDERYATAFGTLGLGITEARLSISNRKAQKLP